MRLPFIPWSICGSAFEPGASGLPYYCTATCARSCCTWRASCADSEPREKKVYCGSARPRMEKSWPNTRVVKCKYYVSQKQNLCMCVCVCVCVCVCDHSACAFAIWNLNSRIWFSMVSDARSVTNLVKVNARKKWRFSNLIKSDMILGKQTHLCAESQKGPYNWSPNRGKWR